MGQAGSTVQGMPGGPMPTGPSALTAAEHEVQAMTDMFWRLSQACYKKCVHRFTDADLSPAETSCIDRCVLKYLQTHQIVGTQINGQAAAQ